MNLHAESRSRRSALGTEQRIAICTLVLALSSFLAGCGKSSANAPGAGPGAMPVQVRIATAAKIPETTEYLSILKSRHSAAINPQVEGQITKILVKSGDHVTAGGPPVPNKPAQHETTGTSPESLPVGEESNMRHTTIFP